jgi:hypothetical protein
MLNIAIVFHGFHGDTKAMSKTARGCGSQAGCESKQHPAILPWPSGLTIDADGHRPVTLIGSFLLPDIRRTHLALRHETRGTGRAQTL